MRVCERKVTSRLCEIGSLALWSFDDNPSVLTLMLDGYHLCGEALFRGRSIQRTMKCQMSLYVFGGLDELMSTSSSDLRQLSHVEVSMLPQTSTSVGVRRMIFKRLRPAADPDFSKGLIGINRADGSG